MRLSDFRHLVSRLVTEVPAEFLDGVDGIEVSPERVPHPERDGVFTLGECIPVPAPDADGIRSRVVLYHGSFQGLADQGGNFDWRGEAWETLTHELRHHLEWRARVPDLEAFDWAAEQNLARHDGESFDPDFHLSAEPVADGITRIDDDVFVDREVKQLAATARLRWAGREYLLELPPGAALPLFLTVDGVADPPPGELVLVLRHRPGLSSLWRRPPPRSARVRARPAGR